MSYRVDLIVTFSPARLCHVQVPILPRGRAKKEAHKKNSFAPLRVQRLWLAHLQTRSQKACFELVSHMHS